MKLKNNKNALIELIANEDYQQWILGSDEEHLNHKWERWLLENPKNKKLHEESMLLWQAGKFTEHSTPDVEQELKVLEDKLNLKSSPVKENSQATILPMKNRNFRKISAAVLAAAVILLVVFYLNTNIINNIFGNEYSTIYTNFGERIKLDLADGSEVILNANSTLHYPTEISAETVNRIYLEGEAFFNIAKRKHGDRQNFIVETDHGIISVLGTRFVVNSRSDQTNVSLISGRIEAIAKSNSENKKYSFSVIMNPGEVLSLKNDTQSLLPKKEILSMQTSWWKEHLLLKNISLKEIILRLKDTYNIEVEIKDKTILNRTITGSIENTNLNIIIEAIGKVIQVPVQIIGNTVVFGKSDV